MTRERQCCQVIQRFWHPTLNQGKLPANFTHRSNQRVWLRCPGCVHECGRQHAWEARVTDLTRDRGRKVCPNCDSRSGNFCLCQSVVNEPRLSKEWHSDNPPASLVAKSSLIKFLWVCPEGHPPYKASCGSRCTHNSGCPECGYIKNRVPHHPVVSVGRPDLAGEWDHKQNARLPSEVTLGSRHRAWWVCSKDPEHRPWQAAIKNRALRGSGCQYLNRFKPGKFGPAGK
jgi:hypothetical protein